MATTQEAFKLRVCADCYHWNHDIEGLTRDYCGLGYRVKSYSRPCRQGVNRRDALNSAVKRWSW